ncbi:sugar phosphate isomerase/epimerase family protein [Aquipuribacter hungaricus]|uniref:Sugar phosphate isomerase/epimerase family protein n=1 Tax=Aquipuribacter hungaricus TaxID=545624 RepID=A0ABV7WB07_9MICO
MTATPAPGAGAPGTDSQGAPARPARPVRLGYGTNGLADHRVDDALAMLADLGYDGVALTLDVRHLDPFADDVHAATQAVARRLDRLGLGVVVETGARYLLDPRLKHEPTLVSAQGVERRVDLLQRAVRIAADLGADAVSCWSGVLAPGLDPDAARRQVADALAQVLEEADRLDVPLAVEPEPGHLVERLDDVLDLRRVLGQPERLRVTLDLGHCVCVEDEPVADVVRRAGDLLVDVQVDDMVRGVHEHLPLGEGALDLRSALAALVETGFTGLAAVELPRHSHAGPDMAARSIASLEEALAALPAAGAPGTDGAADRAVDLSGRERTGAVV